jgi:hypothetical protein
MSFVTLSKRILGNYAIVIAHNPETNKTRIRLPSGAKKTVPSANRAMIGIIFILFLLYILRRSFIQKNRENNSIKSQLKVLWKWKQISELAYMLMIYA